MLMITLLAGCETVTRNNAPNLGKKLGAPKNANQLVTMDDLDDYGRVNFHMAYQYYLNKEFNLSLEKLGITLKRYPKFPEGYNLLGVIEEDRGRTDTALANFKIAFELNPTYAVALSNYARIICQRGLTVMESDIQQISKAHAGLYAATGECAIRNAQYPAALNYAEKAIQLNPEYGQSYYVKSIALNRMGNISSALMALEQFHNLNGYNIDSLESGIKMARQVNDVDMLQKYNSAMQQFTSPAN